MKISTKKGDTGKTTIWGGKWVPKSSKIIKNLGDFDELSSLLGEIFVLIRDPYIKKVIDRVQKDIFKVSAEVAGYKKQMISKRDISCVENLIEDFEKKLPELKNFVLPGGSLIGAKLHVSRTVCRRVERACAGLNKKTKLNPYLIPYLNRLSDLLFLMARFANIKAGVKDKIIKL